ncbi:MAG: helix-turn-helix transcriptional regulator [Acidobacteria bacterium]|nr:helix-turn-helix transcriptional regulator [Acidobacteriota bacterium]
MAARNALLTAPPYAVEAALKTLGQNLRTARLRRNLTIQDVADKIGTGTRAVSDAEKGKASTSAAVYVALLWAYDLHVPFTALADPLGDEEGSALARAGERTRARAKGELDNDF